MGNKIFFLWCLTVTQFCSRLLDPEFGPHLILYGFYPILLLSLSCHGPVFVEQLGENYFYFICWQMLHVYGNYLRAQSFRKALIYQKKYLLVLLGGYQDTEEATLATLASMGAYPSPTDFQHQRNYRRPFTRFRSAVRVVIAIFRMKRIAKKWRRATRVGSLALIKPVEGDYSYVHLLTCTFNWTACVLVHISQ